MEVGAFSADLRTSIGTAAPTSPKRLLSANVTLLARKGILRSTDARDLVDEKHLCERSQSSQVKNMNEKK